VAAAISATAAGTLNKVFIFDSLKSERHCNTTTAKIASYVAPYVSLHTIRI
jgi:hypothetical protein